MQELRNIEFFNDPEGGVMIRDDEGVHTYQPEDKELTSSLFARIESDYPKAFKALADNYRKSRANVNYIVTWYAIGLSAATSVALTRNRT